MKIRAVIVDDERGAREVLASMLTRYCPQVEILAKANSMETGYTAITSVKPDLVFLDIEMPNGNGFDLLEKIGNIDFDIIFTTAYDHYAIKGIKLSAIDYLLKPIDVDELQTAVSNYEKSNNSDADLDSKLKALLSNLNAGPVVKHVGVPDSKGITFVDAPDIVRAETINGLTVLFMKDKSELLSTRPLSEYTQLLIEDDFVRIHRSHLINFNFMKRYVKGDGGFVIMKDETKLEVSRAGRLEISNKIARS